MPARRLANGYASARIPAAERQPLKRPKPQLAQNRKLVQSEASFQAQVVALARLTGWTAWHDAATNAPRRCQACGDVRRGPRNEAGLPDLLLIRGDRLLWVELKSQAGSTSPEQREMIGRLRAAGQTVLIWRPSNWPEIEKELAR